MKLSDKQLDVMRVQGHLLVMGGPGSGKSTVAILKAAEITEHKLGPGQTVLFLSFARATVSRVLEVIDCELAIANEQKRRIDVETYHAFFWRILHTHGYLLGLPRRLSILTPAAEAIALSKVRLEHKLPKEATDTEKAIRKAAEHAERIRLARDEGRVCFDLYAPLVSEILHGSERIRKLISTMYPAIILDEFQDTNWKQWRAVQALGKFSTLFALADPEQRIFDFIGADPQRIQQFREHFAPTEVDLSTENHRSAGTDILQFGNDILKGRFREEPYMGVAVLKYPPNRDQALSFLVTAAYHARRRLVAGSRKNWSLAILVPTKRMTRVVSDSFRSPPAGMTEIHHSAVIELDPAILGAQVIALLLQPDSDGRKFDQFVGLVVNYFQGKGGDTPTKTALDQAEGIQKAFGEYVICLKSGKGIRKKSILAAMTATFDQACSVTLTGDPDRDWQTIRRVLEKGPCTRLNEIASEVRNLRLLERGTQFRQELSQNWRESGAYRNALDITQQAFVREHFSSNAKPETGVVVMNMHKAKGKQFDEVIIFEGWPIISKGQLLFNPDRIVRFNDLINADDEARQNLRVSVTRGKRFTTILTPANDPCVLLPRRV